MDVITETGWYSGSNIKELASSYKLGWCMIHAMVQSDNAATIYVSGDNGKQLIVVKRNTDGTYVFTPYATKSDLTWNPVSISNLNTNAEIPDGGLNNGANIYVFCGRLHIISLSLNLSSAISGNTALFKVETDHAPARSARLVCTARNEHVTAMPYLDNDGHVITAGTIPAGQVKLLGIYMTA